VRISRITEAPHLKLSVALISNLRKKSSISDEYHDFVCLDTGVIAHHTLVDRYELELEKDVERGRGWQLGVYIGHQLFHQQHLAAAKPEETTAEPEITSVILATGVVDTASNVRPVKDIENKLRSAEALIQSAHTRELPVTFYLPQQNITLNSGELIHQFEARYPNLFFSGVERLEFNLPESVEAQRPVHDKVSQTGKARQRQLRSVLFALHSRANDFLKRRVLLCLAMLLLPPAAPPVFVPEDIGQDSASNLQALQPRRNFN